MHYIHLLFSFSFFLCHTISADAQIEDSVEYVYDTVYLPADTIRNYVEIVDYSKKPLAQYNLYVGANASFGATNIHLPGREFSALHKQISACAILARNSLFITINPALTTFSYQNDSTARSALISYRPKTETVAVDTIYWGTPGNSTAEVIYKEVGTQQADSSFSDSTIRIKHSISYFTIPLGIGYRWTNRTISLKACAGAGISFSSQKTKHPFTGLPLSQVRWLTSYFCQVSASYALTESFWASIQASLSQHTSKASRPIHSYSLGLGIIYEIF